MTVATHLFSDIVLKFGFPRILHSDNGMEFKPKLIEYLSQQLGIKKTYISQPIKYCTCCILALYMQLGVGLNSKERQR